MTEYSYTLGQKVLAEFVGTAFLLAIVVASGIMGEQLAGGNVAIALMANAVATGCGLYVLITAFGPVSGAHFNPAVTLMFALGERGCPFTSLLFVIAQVAGAILGVWAAHCMFDLELIQASSKVRSGSAQFVSELIATTGLLGTIVFVLRAPHAPVAACVGSYITAAYWFTSSTSFANPAVTLARTQTDTFAGIRMADMPMFVLAQLIVALIFGLALRLRHKE